MPIFPPDEVLRLARLARLELTPEEVDLFARQLGDILEFARQVERVDTSNASMTASAIEMEGLRADTVRPSLDRDDVLSNAPGADRTAGLFKVPRVLNG